MRRCAAAGLYRGLVHVAQSVLEALRKALVSITERAQVDRAPPTNARAVILAEIGRLQAWLSHLETVLRLKRHLLAVGRQDAAIEEELEQLDVLILMVDRAGRVLHANRLAETAIQDEGGGPSRNMLRQSGASDLRVPGRAPPCDLPRPVAGMPFFAICER